MKWLTSKNKKPIIALLVIIIIIAGLLDLIFKGLLYQSLSSFF